MIRKHTSRAAKAAFAISLGVAIVIGLFAAVFARPAQSAGPTVIIGTKNFPEEFILGQLYKQALEAKGFKVSYKENIGSTELIQTSLTSGKINMYPEYTGVIVQDVFHHAPSAKTASGYLQLAKKLEAAKGYTVLKPTPFFDTDVVAVTNATAKKYGLKSIGDLKKAGSFKLGGFPECKTRNTCFVGYTKQYGITNASFVPLAGISAYAALDAGNGAGGRRVLDRPAARQGLEVHGAGGPEARDRLPERRADRQDVGRDGARVEVHDHRQRGVGEADPERDRRHEQGRDRRQAVGGEGRRGVPEGEPPHLDARRRSRWRVVRRAFRRRPPPARRRRRDHRRRAPARRRRVLLLGVHADEDDAARARSSSRRLSTPTGADRRATRSAAHLRVARPGRRARRLLAGRVARVAQNAKLIRGDAVAVEPGVLSVDDEALQYDRLVIATGSSPAIPPIEGLDSVDYWTNVEATETLEVPERLLVLGGGPVGCELAQFFQRVGSQVTLVQGDTRLLARVDADAAALVEEALREDGVDIRLDARAESVTSNSLLLAGGEELPFDRLLVATGRKPNVDALAALDLTISKRGIEVDERLRAAPDVWALGDVTGIAPFTHVGKYHARIAAYDMAGRDVRADHRAIPATIFTDPQVAMVGDTEGGVSSTWQLTSVPRLSTYERPKRPASSRWSPTRSAAC